MRESTYQWSPDSDLALRITKSSIGTFKWCKKQFEFQYIHRLPQETKDYHTRGINVHDAWEYWNNNINPVLDESKQLLLKGENDKAFDLLWSCMPTPEEEYQYGEEEQLEQLVRWEMGRLLHTDIDDFLPIANEFKLEVEVEVLGYPVVMKGIMDRVYRMEDGTSMLMELKTGKWKPNKRGHMAGELAVYKYMVEASDDPAHDFLKPITYYGYRFPGGGINNGDGAHWNFGEFRRSKRAMERVPEDMETIVKTYLDMAFDPLPQGQRWKCQWCEYTAYCPAWTDVDDET